MIAVGCWCRCSCILHDVYPPSVLFIFCLFHVLLAWTRATVLLCMMTFFRAMRTMFLCGQTTCWRLTEQYFTVFSEPLPPLPASRYPRRCIRSPAGCCLILVASVITGVSCLEQKVPKPSREPSNILPAMHFSDSGGEIGRACVCLCVRTMTFELNNFWGWHLARCS